MEICNFSSRMHTLSKLRKKMEEKGENVHKMKFKTVTKKQVLKMMSKMKKKKSSGVDGLSQSNLVLGKSVLAEPLTNIINKSISQGLYTAKKAIKLFVQTLPF